jgi:hypothetical protein
MINQEKTPFMNNAERPRADRLGLGQTNPKATLKGNHSNVKTTQTCK